MKPINGWTKKKMITHIKAEFKGKSVDAGDNCMYRGPDGKKCAVGMFIPDSKYDPKMDKTDTNVAIRVLPEFGLVPFMPLDVMGMERLQRIHDRSEPKNTLKDIITWIKRNVESE